MVLTKKESKLVDQSFHAELLIDQNKENERKTLVNENISQEKYVEFKSEIAQVIMNNLFSSSYHYLSIFKKLTNVLFLIGPSRVKSVTR